MNHVTFTIDQLDSSIEKAVNKYVNGKVDKISKEIGELRGDFNKHVSTIEPVLKQFNDRRGFWNTLSSYQKNIGMIVAIITGLGIIVAFLMK